MSRRDNDFNMRVIDMMMALDANKNANPEGKRLVMNALSSQLRTPKYQPRKRTFWDRLTGRNR